jgi:hypothetical protein
MLVIISVAMMAESLLAPEGPSPHHEREPTAVSDIASTTCAETIRS